MWGQENRREGIVFRWLPCLAFMCAVHLLPPSSGATVPLQEEILKAIICLVFMFYI